MSAINNTPNITARLNVPVGMVIPEGTTHYEYQFAKPFFKYDKGVRYQWDAGQWQPQSVNPKTGKYMALPSQTCPMTVLPGKTINKRNTVSTVYGEADVIEDGSGRLLIELHNNPFNIRAFYISPRYLTEYDAKMSKVETASQFSASYSVTDFNRHMLNVPVGLHIPKGATHYDFECVDPFFKVDAGAHYQYVSGNWVKLAYNFLRFNPTAILIGTIRPAQETFRVSTVYGAATVLCGTSDSDLLVDFDSNPFLYRLHLLRKSELIDVLP